MGVMNTTVTELTQVKEHEGTGLWRLPSFDWKTLLTKNAARMYTILPMVWSIG
jgi:hypothetical protein